MTPDGIMFFRPLKETEKDILILKRQWIQRTGSIYEIIYKLSIICFVCVKEMPPWDVSFTHTKHVFDREKKRSLKHFLGVTHSYVYLPIIQTLIL